MISVKICRYKCLHTEDCGFFEIKTTGCDRIGRNCRLGCTLYSYNLPISKKSAVANTDTMRCYRFNLGLTADECLKRVAAYALQCSDIILEFFKSQTTVQLLPNYYGL